MLDIINKPSGNVSGCCFIKGPKSLRLPNNYLSTFLSSFTVL